MCVLRLLSSLLVKRDCLLCTGLIVYSSDFSSDFLTFQMNVGVWAAERKKQKEKPSLKFFLFLFRFTLSLCPLLYHCYLMTWLIIRYSASPLSFRPPLNFLSRSIMSIPSEGLLLLMFIRKYSAGWCASFCSKLLWSGAGRKQKTNKQTNNVRSLMANISTHSTCKRKRRNRKKSTTPTIEWNLKPTKKEYNFKRINQVLEFD